MTLPTDYQSYIHISRYSRWRDDLGRRETWEETVDRYFNFFSAKLGDQFDEGTRNALRTAVLNLEVMPSMRCLMTAGRALERDNVAGYNCSYIACNRVRAFDEIMYVLMCGTGVGFSVERQYINQLPEVAEDFHESDTTIIVPDSKIGWATSFRELISLLYAGKIPKWDLSKIRPAGARLKTFGGRASGPEPLRSLYQFSVELFKKAAGRKLNSIECHDLVCKIADIVVVGGVRRSALISLSNLTDERMRVAKSGSWWIDNPQRALANNSVCYTEKPDIGIFMKEWLSLYESKSGERGIYNRVASQRIAKRNGRRDPDYEFGTNPCSEIILRDRQFCNLSEVVVRNGDTAEELKRKVELATILGTMQATLTDFRYLSHEWEKNTKEEALLGVSLTGIMDNPITSNNTNELALLLQELRNHAVDVNRYWAERFSINPAAAITCVKPSGTVSQLVNSSSGIHPRYSRYYIRTVRTDKKDPVYQFLRDEGVPVEDEKLHPESTAVFSFYMKSPDTSVLRNDRSAIEQLELWKTYAEYWCEHKPSVTIYVKESEWLDVGAWCYANFQILSGVSFLPHTDHNYVQAPYQEITEEVFKHADNRQLRIDWTKLMNYETMDNTSVQPELACTAGVCEL